MPLVPDANMDVDVRIGISRWLDKAVAAESTVLDIPGDPGSGSRSALKVFKLAKSIFVHQA